MFVEACTINADRNVRPPQFPANLKQINSPGSYHTVAELRINLGNRGAQKGTFLQNLYFASLESCKKVKGLKTSAQQRDVAGPRIKNNSKIKNKKESQWAIHFCDSVLITVMTSFGNLF